MMAPFQAPEDDFFSVHIRIAGDWTGEAMFRTDVLVINFILYDSYRSYNPDRINVIEYRQEIILDNLLVQNNSSRRNATDLRSYE